MLTKYNILFNILHNDFLECIEIVEGFLLTYYEERKFKVWCNSLIMNDNPTEYSNTFDKITNENVNISIEEIRKQNLDILNSFKE